MKELKNIDRLYQEKFKDFEAPPPPEVWSRISEKLDADKKKRRIIPWWYWTSGVAALFIIGILGWNAQSNKIAVESDTNSGVVIMENQNIPDVLEESGAQDDNTLLQNPILSNKTVDEVVSTSEKSPSDKSAVYNESLTQTERMVRTRAEASSINSNTDKKSITEGVIQNSSERLVGLPKAIETLPKSNDNEEKSSSVDEIFTEKSNNLADNTLVNDESLLSTEILEVNELERLLQEKLNSKDMVEAKEKPDQRWLVNTVVAPVGFGTTGTGSILDPSLAANNTSQEVSMSFGVGMQYKIDKRLTVRTGVHRVTLGHNTNDLDFMPNMSSARRLQNVNHTPQGSTINVQTKSGVTSIVENTVSVPNGGYLNQRMGFVEVPAEVSYKLFGSKFGVTLIGGISSLFLTDNRVEAVAHSFQTNLGEANNINSLSFSSNIGLGIEYSFLKNFQAHLEPMFKYQFNTFRGDIGSIQPFFFGVYSGISYKF